MQQLNSLDDVVPAIRHSLFGLRLLDAPIQRNEPDHGIEAGTAEADGETQAMVSVRAVVATLLPLFLYLPLWARVALSASWPRGHSEETQKG